MACRICSASVASVIKHASVPDFEHGSDVRVRFDECPRCGSLSQTPTPDPHVLEASYPDDYRPHVQSGGWNREGIFLRLKYLQARLLVRSLRRWLPDRDAPILELGCGAGRFLFALRDRGFTNLTGVDRHPGAAAGLKSRGIGFEQGDFEGDMVFEHRFSLIVLNYVLEHAVDPELLLRRCGALLAEGGRIVVLTPSADSFCHRFFGRYWSGLHAPRHVEVFSPRGIESMARRVGLTGQSLYFPVDAGSWTLSFQNTWRSKHRSGTSPLSLLLLPFWYPFALFEKLLSRGSSLVAVMAVQ